MKNNNKNRKRLFIQKMNSYARIFGKETKDMMLAKFGKAIVMEKVLEDIKMSKYTARLKPIRKIKIHVNSEKTNEALEEFKKQWMELMSQPAQPIMIIDHDSEPTFEFIYPSIGDVFNETIPNYGHPPILKLLPDLKMRTLADQEKLQPGTHPSPHNYEPRFD